MTAAAVPMAPLTPPKRILVQGHRIRLRWLQQAVWGFLAANAGALIISALYYAITQVTYGHVGHTALTLKPAWDHLFGFKGWDADRHDIRNVYEGALATLFVKSLLANWRKNPDRRVGPLRVITAPLLLILAAAPVVILGVFILNHAGPWVWHQWFATHRVTWHVTWPHSLVWLQTYLSGWPWQPLVIGIVTGQVVHRLYAPVGNTVQLFFVERQVDKTRDGLARWGIPEAGEAHRPRWPLPPVIRERYAWIIDNDIPVPDHGDSPWFARAVWAVSVIMFALLCWGAYIRYWIAKGH